MKVNKNEVVMFGQKKIIKTFKPSDEPITRCNKNMKDMRVNRLTLQLSWQHSNKETFCEKEEK